MIDLLILNVNLELLTIKPLEKHPLSCYPYSMKIEINARGNGACPLCASNGNCRVQDTLKKAMDSFSSQNDPMELVVYSCPQFEEKS
ncbi:hypothetical protein AGMMS50293_09150 [Spirochaetia bacterium]|nr:hypothetical protein AGMMS50293_09150 [Spirochaetia bacterium]